MNAQRFSFGFRRRLKQVRGRYINSSASILDEPNFETFLTQIAGGKETTNVESESADHHACDGARPQKRGKPWMLSRDGISFEISVIALPPNRGKALGLEAGNKFRPR